MSETEALGWIEQIVRDELDNDDVSLELDLAPGDIEGWDSLAHVGIVVAIEKKIGRQFTTEQIDGVKTVGDLVRLALLG
jgi:acyl carrier protein